MSDGHVDFYGKIDGVGWFLSGWLRFDLCGGQIAANFREAQARGETIAAYYFREDLLDYGRGYVFLIKDTSSPLTELVSLEIQNADASAEIVPAPPPHNLKDGALLAMLLPLLGTDVSNRALIELKTLASHREQEDLQPDRTDVPSLRSNGGISQRDERISECEIIINSGLFDIDFYRQHYSSLFRESDPLLDFILFGQDEGRKPNLYFDPAWYMKQSSDATADLNPLFHYITHGDSLGRRPSLYFDPTFYRKKYNIPETVNTLSHYMTHRRTKKFSPIPEFDVDFYCEHYSDIAAADIDPFEHYLFWGFKEGRRPSSTFNTHYYVQKYLSGDAEQNPLAHFLEHRGEPGSYELLLNDETTVHREIKKYTAVGEFYEEFVPIRGIRPRAKALAYYLPQFHSFPENDAWWGKGFTEWTNIARGVPRFRGHYQPRIPRDLGFYTLDNNQPLRRQVEMAKAAGIFGFVFYYYWFNGKRLLDEPLERLLSDPSIDMPFCLMWANENWTRRWDGSESEVLISQDYHPNDDRRLVDSFTRHFTDPRYIRIGRRPLLMIYRPSLIPNANEAIARWRARLAQESDNDPILIMAQSFDDVDPRPYGLDGAIEFPPHKLTRGLPDINSQVQYLDADFSGRVYRYEDVVDVSLRESSPPFPLIKTVFPSWDNDARRQGRGVTIADSSPLKYEAWLSEVVERAIETPFFGEPLVCINAWNEWCEAAYLEPDQYFGAAYLNATARALLGRTGASEGVRLLLIGHDAFPSGAQINLAHIGRYLRRCFGVECEFLLLTGGGLETEYRNIAPTTIVTNDNQLLTQLTTFRDRGFTKALVNTSAAAIAVNTLHDVGMQSVVLIHELPRLIREKNLTPGLQAAVDKASRLVFPAMFVRDQVLKVVGADADQRSVILPQGCYKEIVVSTEAGLEVRKELGIARGEALVLGVGYADLRKGFDLFIHLWRTLHSQNPKVHLCWIGDIDPSLREWLANDIAAATETGTFHLVGYRPDVNAFLSAASAFVLTSREDPFPTVVLEALAAGLATFAFDRSGGMPDMLRQHEIGTVLPFGDVAAMASAVLRSLSQPVRKIARERRREVVHHHFSFKTYVAELLKLAYPDLLTVSAAVPNYNYARYLAGRMESVFNQSSPISEIIILDDASRDDSLKVIERTAAAADREVTILANRTNSGSVFNQWRKAATLAKSELIWIAEADDLAEPTFLFHLLSLMASDPAIRLAFCDSQTIDEDGKPMWSSYKPYFATIRPGALSHTEIFEGTDFVADLLSVKNTILNVSSVVWRRDALLSALDACDIDLRTYKMAGDWRLYLEVLKVPGARIAYEARPLNIHRRHAQSVTHSLDVRRHLDEIARCHAVARGFFVSPDCEDRQAAYLSEVKAQLERSMAA